MVPVLQGLQTAPGLAGVVLTQFDVSETGTLAYAPAPTGERPDRLLWVDLKGRESLIVEGPGTWVHPRLSPDGSRVSLDIHSRDGMRDLYIYELERKQLRKLTRTGMTWESEWRPDGRRIAMLSGAPAGQWSLFWIPTDFSGPPELLHPSHHAIPGSWLADGKSLLFSEWVEGGVWKIAPEGDRTPTLIMQTQAREGFPRLSPDGRWITFVETESGRNEVFVQSFPDLGAKHQVSIDGGREPVWSRDGRRLFLRQADGMFAVDVRHEPAIRFAPPRLLFRGEFDSADVGHQHYDISLENDRFLMIKHGEPEGPFEVRVVLNWSEELKRR
jgi:Tol biopolymer transport system component